MSNKTRWTAEEFAHYTGREVSNALELLDAEDPGDSVSVTEIIEALGVADANHLCRDPAAFILSAHSERGVGWEQWHVSLRALHLVSEYEASSEADGWTDTTDVMDFEVAVEHAIQTLETGGSVDTHELYDQRPDVVRDVLKRARRRDTVNTITADGIAQTLDLLEARLQRQIRGEDVDLEAMLEWTRQAQRDFEKLRQQL